MFIADNTTTSMSLSTAKGADGLWMTEDDGLRLQQASTAFKAGNRATSPDASILSRVVGADDPVNLGAYFAVMYDLTLQKTGDPDASISPAVGSYEVQHGYNQPIIAYESSTASLGFEKWQTASDNVTIDNINSLSTNLSLTGDATVTAFFNTRRFEIKVTVVDGKGQESTVGGTAVASKDVVDYDENFTLTITPTANTTYRLKKVLKADGSVYSGLTEGANTISNVTANVDLTVHFGRPVEIVDNNPNVSIQLETGAAPADYMFEDFERLHIYYNDPNGSGVSPDFDKWSVSSPVDPGDPAYILNWFVDNASTAPITDPLEKIAARQLPNAYVEMSGGNKKIVIEAIEK
ncbi:MAG: hypothetical protein GF398_19990 [Chitinivibrionales bacterium]|nr:hypothetical protein [Chitinivibrionales bacterium]